MTAPNTNSSYKDLTELQLALLDVLWAEGEVTVAEATEALLAERALASTTVATLLSRLERRGVVTHRIEGRQYVYRADVTRAEVRASMVTALANRLFKGDVAALMSHLLTESEIAAGDLERVRALIDEKTREKEE